MNNLGSRICNENRLRQHFWLAYVVPDIEKYVGVLVILCHLQVELCEVIIY